MANYTWPLTLGKQFFVTGKQNIIIVLITPQESYKAGPFCTWACKFSWKWWGSAASQFWAINNADREHHGTQKPIYTTTDKHLYQESSAALTLEKGSSHGTNS